MAVHQDAVPIAALNQLEIVTRAGTTMTIELAGEWDLACTPAVRRAMASALADRPEYIVLDLSRLAFIDSCGLHATIELAQHATAEHIPLVIIPGAPAIHRVFEITGLTERLPFVDEQWTGSGPARSRTARRAQRDLAAPLSRRTAPAAAPRRPAPP
jgi:anti-sigma B factor antagonist